MDQILKALDDALQNKEFHIKYLTEEISKLKAENEALKSYVEELEKDLDFYKPTTTATVTKEDF